MSKIDLLNLLTNGAKNFRNDLNHYSRNKHMHDIVIAPKQEEIDAVLVGFINYIAATQGVDYALYAQDLTKK